MLIPRAGRRSLVLLGVLVLPVSSVLADGGAGGVAVVRGPYLQAATPTQVTVRWRVAPASAGRVRLGDGAPLARTFDSPVATDHSVTLTGLSPGTRYRYNVGTPEATLAGGEEGFAFVTPPAPGTAPPLTRLWVLGDSGTADANAARVRDAFLASSRDHAPDIWLMLGDNAYPRGSDEEYQRALFDFFPELLRTTALWPAMGNTDVLCCESNPTAAPYLRIFSPPTAGEAGGVPSGSPLYYSFDHGNVHVVVLDSMVSDRTLAGPMLGWLGRDLAANDKKWLIAGFHHPPYTMGEHDSDFERAHIQMRENAVPILEAHGVDLVLGGHSHSYERSFLLDGHHGNSDSLTAAMKKDPGMGRPEGGGYRKAAGPRQGAVYVVLGNAGQLSRGPLNHPAMAVSALALGSLVVDIQGDELRGTFLRDTGAVDDQFVIRKTGAPPDAGTDAGPAPAASGGCGCTLGAATGVPGALVLCLALFLVLRRRTG